MMIIIIIVCIIVLRHLLFSTIFVCFFSPLVSLLLPFFTLDFSRDVSIFYANENAIFDTIYACARDPIANILPAAQRFGPGRQYVYTDKHRTQYVVIIFYGHMIIHPNIRIRASGCVTTCVQLQTVRVLGYILLRSLSTRYTYY